MSIHIENRQKSRAARAARSANEKAAAGVKAAQLEADRKTDPLDVTIDRWDGEGGAERPSETSASKI